MNGEPCRLCGGDGRIGNSLGRSSATCPSCHGSGRRDETSSAFHDVTKTKPSHHRREPGVSPAAAGPKGPQTSEGAQLAQGVAASSLSADAKARLIAEIVNHEQTHGRCTKTFIKKLQKQTKVA